MFHKFNLIKITILFQIQTGVGGTLRGRGDCSFRQDFCGGIHHRRPYPRHPRASRVPKGHLVQHHRSACQQRCHRRRLSSRDTVNYSEGEIFFSFFLVFKTFTRVLFVHLMCVQREFAEEAKANAEGAEPDRRFWEKVCKGFLKGQRKEDDGCLNI